MNCENKLEFESSKTIEDNDFLMIKKEFFKEDELDFLCEIIYKNMQQIGLKAFEEDKGIWKNNVNEKLKSENFYFYVVYYKNEIVGFVELLTEENYIYLREIELCDKIKRTKILLFILNFLVSQQEFFEYDDINFSVNKNNEMSNKTFSHLGGKIIKTTDKQNLYQIKKERVESYLFNIFNKNKNSFNKTKQFI
ncbi:MAG: hypothetical protein IJX26_04340 [Clostridia bacterium]|nr:hypothetical protein [Clostridia bacterium]